MEGRPYCYKCAIVGNECGSCNRPLPVQYYDVGSSICRACVKKKQKGGRRQALQGEVTEQTFYPENKDDPLLAFKGEEQDIEETLYEGLRLKRSLKWQLKVVISFVKYNADLQAVYAESDFYSEQHVLLNEDDVEHQIGETFQELFSGMESFESNGSGWIIVEVKRIVLTYVSYQPLMGSSFLELPAFIKNTKSVVNIQNNTDEKCFYWCVLAALFPVNQNPERVTLYERIRHTLDFRRVTFPTPIKDIDYFEEDNPTVSINVFTYEEDVIYPLRISQREQAVHNIELLLVFDETKRHYALIKNFNRLMASRTTRSAQSYYCRRCLHEYTNERLLREHGTSCSKIAPQRVTMPKPGKEDILEFRNVKAQCPADFVIYCDFESYLNPIDTCGGDPERSSTTKLQKHHICAFGYKVVSTNEKYTKPVYIYTGSNAGQKFLERIMMERDEIYDIIVNKPLPLRMTPQEQASFEAADSCWICKQKYQPGDKPPVRDHGHVDGKYIRGSK